MEEVILSPSDLVAAINQTFDYAYPLVVVEGELSNFRVSKNRWVYFDLKDELAVVSFFGTIYQLPGPLQDGLMVRVTGVPRLHPRFGFSVNVQALRPTGEGSLRKAAELLRHQLAAEGLFAPERKRSLPPIPARVGLITSAASAAAADFTKVLAQRWGGVEIWLADSLVQGENAAAQLVAAIEHFSQLPELPDVLVITRGGGSAEDLAVFNDERLVRAVAASRVPTLVAIGHEVDTSLAELAADKRASTPSNAAELLVPDKRQELSRLVSLRGNLARQLADSYQATELEIKRRQTDLNIRMNGLINFQIHRLVASRQILALLDPRTALARGYALVRKNGQLVRSVAQVSRGDHLTLQLQGGIIDTDVIKISKH